MPLHIMASRQKGRSLQPFLASQIFLQMALGLHHLRMVASFGPIKKTVIVVFMPMHIMASRHQGRSLRAHHYAI
jgi:hypothetical protein